MTVTELLAAARDAHKIYQGLKPRMERQGGALVKVDGDPAQAGAWSVKALALFTEARALDASALSGLDRAVLDFHAEQLSRA